METFNSDNIPNTFSKENRLPSLDNELFNYKSLIETFTKYSKSQKSLFNYEKEVRESSLERIERKIDRLSNEVATRDDIIKQTEMVLGQQRELNTELEKKLEILRSMQEANVPHKRLAKGSLTFLTFFTLAFLSNVFFGITIVTPFWSNIGLLFSFGFLLMAWAMGVDWENLLKQKS